MPEKPIYIYLGDTGFSLSNARRKRLLAPGEPYPVRSARDALASRKFAEDERLLRHDDMCDGDMISLEEPDETTWESLRQFIAAGGGLG